jgi:hypothetical protein
MYRMINSGDGLTYAFGNFEDYLFEIGCFPIADRSPNNDPLHFCIGMRFPWPTKWAFGYHICSFVHFAGREDVQFLLLLHNKPVRLSGGFRQKNADRKI